MTVGKVQQVVRGARLAENDRRWFPKLARAIEFYRDQVLGTGDPRLDKIRQKLEQAARACGGGCIGRQQRAGGGD